MMGKEDLVAATRPSGCLAFTGAAAHAMGRASVCERGVRGFDWLATAPGPRMHVYEKHLDGQPRWISGHTPTSLCKSVKCRILIGARRHQCFAVPQAEASSNTVLDGSPALAWKSVRVILMIV